MGVILLFHFGRCLPCSLNSHTHPRHSEKTITAFSSHCHNGFTPIPSSSRSPHRKPDHCINRRLHVFSFTSPPNYILPFNSIHLHWPRKILEFHLHNKLLQCNTRSDLRQLYPHLLGPAVAATVGLRGPPYHLSSTFCGREEEPRQKRRLW